MIMNHFAKTHNKNSHKGSQNSDRISIPPPPPPPPSSSQSNWRYSGISTDNSYNNPDKRSFSPKFAEPYVPTQKKLKTSSALLSTNNAPLNPPDYDYRGSSMSNEWNYHPSGQSRSNSSPFVEHTLSTFNPNEGFWPSQPASSSSSTGNFYHFQSGSYSSNPLYPMNYGNQYGRPVGPQPPTSTVATPNGQQTSGSHTPAYNPWSGPGSNSTPNFSNSKYYGNGRY